MEKLRAWLQRRSFALRLGAKRDAVFYGLEEVTISTRQTPALQLHSALHECGHVAIFRERVLRPDRVVAGSTLRSWVASKRRSAAEKRRVLEEEVEAWRRGERLGRRLRLKLPSAEERRRHRSRCLATYVRWTLLPTAPRTRRAQA